MYWDAKMLNEKGVMTQLVTKERRVITRSLVIVPDVHKLFDLYKCGWMAQDLGTYNEEIVR